MKAILVVSILACSLAGTAGRAAAVLLPPSSLTAGALSGTAIFLSWTDTNGGGANYSVERSVSPSTGFIVVANTGLDDTTYIDTGLVSSTRYYYRVRAFGSREIPSAYSVTVAAATRDETDPTVPTSVGASAPDCATVNVQWGASIDMGGAGLWGYAVYRDLQLVAWVAAPGTSFSDTGRTGSTTYSYRVAALDNLGNISDQSAPAAVTTPACAGSSCGNVVALPSGGGTFTGTTSGSSSLAGTCGATDASPETIFQWTPATSGTATIGTCGGGTTFDTVLYMRQGACASGTEVACNDDACYDASGSVHASLITVNVAAGQTYFIVVDGYGGAQGSFVLTVTPPASATPTTTTSTTLPDTTPPSVPTGLTARAVSCGEIDVSWNPSSDNPGGSGVQGYNLYRNGVLMRQVRAASGACPPASPIPTAVADAGRIAVTGYSYNVSAFDCRNNTSAVSGPVSITTPACPTTTTTPTTTTSTTLPPSGAPELIGVVPGVGRVEGVVVDTSKGLAYLASHEFGLSIVDVHNPNQPVAIGAASPPFYGDRVAVSGSLAVVAGGEQGMTVVDVSDPTSPTVVGSLGLDVVNVAIVGSYAYARVEMPGTSAHIDFAVVDLRVPSNPVIVSQTFMPAGLGITVVGSLAYVAAGNAGLQIYDLTIPTAPRLVGTVGNVAAGYVAAANGYAYVTSSTTLWVIDARSPAAPVAVASLPLAGDLAVANNRLYVAGGPTFTIVDVSTPTAPTIIGQKTNFPSTLGSYSVAVAGSQAYLTSPNTGPFSYAGAGLYVVDVSVPSNPVLLANLNGLFDAGGVAVSNSLAVVTGQAGKGVFTGLRVLDVSTPSAPRVVGSLTGSSMMGVAIAGQFAYVRVFVPGALPHIDLGVVDLRDPTHPALVNDIYLPSGSKVAVVGSVAYVGAGSAGLQLYDITTPAAPRLLGTANVPGGSLAVTNGYAYVGGGATLYVIDTHLPSAPRVVTSLPLNVSDMTLAGSRLYVVDGLNFKIVDVSTPTTPAILSTTPNVTASGVVAIGTRAFLTRPPDSSTPQSSLYVVDASTPTAPRFTTTLPLPGNAVPLAATPGFVYAADGAATLDVVSPGS